MTRIIIGFVLLVAAGFLAGATGDPRALLALFLGQLGLFIL